MHLLVGKTEFWSQLQADLGAARQEIVVQAMTWEGDDAGLQLADLLATLAPVRRRLLVDSYTRYVVSDRFVYTPSAWLDAGLRAEVRRTRQMFDELRQSGAEVRFSNPVGTLFWRYPARNHKKLIVIDGRIAYLGGFNFSDHNFAWHDLMVRLDDRDAASFLQEDFDATWQGKDRARCARFSGCELHTFDGLTNEAAFATILAHIGSAQRSVQVISPYLTFPFCAALRQLVRRQVPVTLITPAANNKGLVGDCLHWEAARSGFDVRLYPGMSHMKAMLIDDRQLIVGSSNFDFLSYRIEQELLAVIDDRSLIEQFRRRVLEPDLAACVPPGTAPSRWRGRSAYAMLQAVDKFALAIRRPPTVPK